METNKLLNSVIWLTVIGGGLYFLYKKFGNSEKKWSLQEVKKRYPEFTENTSKKRGNPYISKSFWTINKDGSKFKEMWLILYHNNSWKIYTRETPEKFVSGGYYTSPTHLRVTEGFNNGNTFKTNSLAKSVEKILNQDVSDLPKN